MTLRARFMYVFLGVVLGAAVAAVAYEVLWSHTPLKRADFISLRLEREPCLGRCPVYALVVHGNGEVEYLGGAFVRSTGRQTSRIASTEVDDLLRRLERTDFLLQSQDCVIQRTDAPGALLRLEMRGIAKEVHFNAGCRETEIRELYEIADAMDRAANTRQWIGERSERLPPS